MALERWHWLQAAWSFRKLSTRRKPQPRRMGQIESLEPRALLTAPVVINSAANPSEDLAYPGTVANLASDADGDSLTFSVVSDPAHGSLTLNTNGTFTYTPDADYNGLDHFTFQAYDGVNFSNVGTFALAIQPVDDPLKLTFPSATAQIPRTSSPTRIDPAATVGDVDTAIDYSKAQIRVTIPVGNTNGDYQKGRVITRILSQLPGPGAVVASQGKLYYNGSPTPIGTYSGGTLGHALTVKFNNGATSDMVNAVLRQISLQCSKKATTGNRTVQFTVSAGGQKVIATKTATVI